MRDKVPNRIPGLDPPVSVDDVAVMSAEAAHRITEGAIQRHLVNNLLTKVDADIDWAAKKGRFVVKVVVRDYPSRTVDITRQRLEQLKYKVITSSDKEIICISWKDYEI